MKIRFIYKSGPHTGKGKFAVRLATALRARGVVITDDLKEPVDIDLQFGKRAYEPKHCKKTVLRLGPAHVDKNQNYKKLNKPKWKSAKHSDGVIYQSEYSRKVCHAFLGKPHGMEAVIYNGAPLTNGHIEPEHFTVVAITRKWLFQKRLRDAVKGFIMADILNSRMYVYGEPDAWAKVMGYGSENIEYRGLVDDDELHSILLRAHVMIHPVYLDACPNAVVEALAHCVPVVCGDQGGTHELVADRGGIVIKDAPYDFRPTDLHRPPRLSPAAIAKAVSTIHTHGYPMKTSHIDIEYIAAQYHKFFEELLVAGTVVLDGSNG